MSSGFIETGLSNQASHIHRALASLQEELEAIDSYHQRVDVSDDESLKAILVRNRDDEMEHASMLMEWLRRVLPGFDLQLRKFLFTTDPIAALAEGGGPPAAIERGLGIGNLK